MDDIYHYINQDGEEVKKSNSYKILLVINGKLLLINNELTPERLTVPGGRAQVGEDLQQTLEREFLEETGIALKIRVEKLVYTERAEFRSPVSHVLCDITNHYYLCRPATATNLGGLAFYDMAKAMVAVSHGHEKAAIKKLIDG